MEGFVLKPGQVVVVPEEIELVVESVRQKENGFPWLVRLRELGRAGDRKVYQFYDMFKELLLEGERHDVRRGSRGFVLFVRRQPHPGERILVIWTDANCAAGIVLPDKSLVDVSSVVYHLNEGANYPSDPIFHPALEDDEVADL